MIASQIVGLAMAVILFVAIYIAVGLKENFKVASILFVFVTLIIGWMFIASNLLDGTIKF